FLTWTGVKRLVLVPSPSCPLPLAPQLQTVPSVFSARLWLPPAAISVIDVKKPVPPCPLTCTGDVRWVVVLSPSLPLPLFPHAHTVPSDLSARACKSPAPIAMMPVSPDI